MYENLGCMDALPPPRCLLCKITFPSPDMYKDHMKEHLTEYIRSRQPPPQPSTIDSFPASSAADLQHSPETCHLQLPGKARGSRKRLKKRRKRTHEMMRVDDWKDNKSHDSYSDDCLGDSELSDSDTEEERNDRLERDRREMRTLLAKTRLSLAEKQLDGGDSDDLVCLTCLKKFSNIQNLRRHLRLHMSRDSNIPDAEIDGEQDDKNFKFSCDFCPEKFANKAAYAVHEKTHGADKKPVCYVCGKKYADRYTLRYHLRTHGVGHQIRCELCNKSFPKPSRLTAHMNTFHKNIRNFTCSKCDKSFKTRLHLETHQLLHTGERPHKCPDCGDSFRHKVSLIAHQRIHTDIRPYVCETCGKRFREPSTLKAHTRVHSGDRPYKCDFCDKSFTQRAGLNYHKSVHVGEKPHNCTRCSFSTIKMSSLRSHEKSIHKLNESSNLSLNGDDTGSRALSRPEVISEGASTLTVPINIPQQNPPHTISQGTSTNLPLPSPPLLPGDAILAESSTTQNIYTTPSSTGSSNHNSNSLPSFNILKSYESSLPQGAILSQAIKCDNKEEHRVLSEDRQSPYSQPSLSPPLTPPGIDYSYPRDSYPAYPAVPLNYSTNYSSSSSRDCPGAAGGAAHGYLDQPTASEYYSRLKYSGDGQSGYLAAQPEKGGYEESRYLRTEACSGGLVMREQHHKKVYSEYENYYDYSYYHPRAIPMHNNSFDYQ